MLFKFNCPACGQRISAQPEQYRTTGPCPTCGAQLLVPMPTVPLRSSSPALPTLIKRLEKMGFTYARPAQPMDDAEEIRRLSAVVAHFEQLDSILYKLEGGNELARQAKPAEVMSIRTRLFAVIMSGDFSGTDEEVKRLIFESAPNLRQR